MCRDKKNSFMDDFSGYNQIQIKLEYQHKTVFICPWDTFSYRKIPFVLKNTRATFQQAIKFSFHELKRIIEVYLDDLSTHSCFRVNHPYHWRLVFQRSLRYKIWLNPQKCIFYVKVGHLLGFIVLKEGISIDILKVESIL